MVSPDLERLRQQVLAQPGGVAGPARINAAPQPIQMQQSPRHELPAFVYRLWYRLEPLTKAWQWLQSTAASSDSRQGRMASSAQEYAWAYWKLRTLLGAVFGAGFGIYLWLSCPSCINGEVYKMIGAMAAGGAALCLFIPAIFFLQAGFSARWWRWIMVPGLVIIFIRLVNQVFFGD